MSESPEERRERLLTEMDDAYEWQGTEGSFDALLAALEPPVADMVRRGVRSMEMTPAPVNRGWWYRPRSEP